MRALCNLQIFVNILQFWRAKHIPLSINLIFDSVCTGKDFDWKKECAAIEKVLYIFIGKKSEDFFNALIINFKQNSALLI